MPRSRAKLADHLVVAPPMRPGGKPAAKSATASGTGKAPRPARLARQAAPPRAALTDSAAPTNAPAGGDTSTQRIVESITNAIVERRLMPGTKLVESKLGEIFAVSRTVVRQALNRLSRDHLVTLTPARGAFVAEPSVDEARQVFQVRKMLEASMVRLLCVSISAEQVAELRQHLRDEAQAVARTDVPGRTHLLADFHAVLARMLGNEVLAHLLQDLLARCSLVALMYQSAHSAEHSQDEHVAIVDALERRDTRTAVRLMEQHLEHVERNLRLHPRAPDLASALAP